MMINNMTVGDINEAIAFSGALTVLLVVAYFKYDTSRFFRAFGNIFIKFSILKRNKLDLLVFAIIPFFMFIMFLVLRLILAGVV